MTEQEIFLAVIELSDPKAQQAYLDPACAGNPELRKQQTSGSVAACARQRRGISRDTRRRGSRPERGVCGIPRNGDGDFVDARSRQNVKRLSIRTAEG